MTSATGQTRTEVPGAGPVEPARDVVFTFSFDTWGDAVARGMNRPPDRLVETMLDHERVSRLLVANPFRSAPLRAAKALAGRREAPFPGDDRHGLVTPLRLARHDRTDVPALRKTYARYDAALARAALRHGLTQPAVITTHPLVAGFAPLRWAGRATFYVRDDWAAVPARAAYAHAYRAAYREVRASGRAVAAVSQQILERLEPTGPCAVVPNGIEPAEWLGPVPAAPAWFSALPGPRAVYVGTVDSRLDIQGLTDLARRRPELSIVLVGPNHDPAWTAAIDDVPSVHWHDTVGRAEIVSLVRNADVCLISHRKTELTAAMSPLKLYEYLAGGRPVIATDMPPVRDISERVLLVDEVAQFADVLDAALALGPQPEQDRQAFLHEHSWRSRHEQILSLALA